jgi:hypothetical protein
MNQLLKARTILPLTQAKATETAWHRLLATISKPDFITVVGFCAIGLLATLTVMQRFPDWERVIQLYNQF